MENPIRWTSIASVTIGKRKRIGRNKKAHKQKRHTLQYAIADRRRFPGLKIQVENVLLIRHAVRRPGRQ